jgi:hypothetical protein
MKHPDPHDYREGTNQGARQKLLGSSDSETEAVVGVEKLAGKLDHDNNIKG